MAVGMRVEAKQCLLGELKDGELYSPANQRDWDMILDPPIHSVVVGHRLFLRSNDVCPEEDAMLTVYRLTIIRD